MNLRLSIFQTVLLTLVAMAICTHGVQAQGIPSGISGLELTASTDNPFPGQTVTITARSYSTDINSATLTWTAGGKVIVKGVGVTSTTVQAPALGKELNVSVTATISDGMSYSNSITIGSASVDMIIESNGFTPPTFLGKVPVAYQNAVKVVAVPHIANSAGVEYDPKNLIYKWEQGSNVLEDQSGYGKQSVTIPGTIIPRPYLLIVTVSTSDGRSQGVGMIAVTPTSPSLVFYRNDVLYGTLYNNAISSNIYMGNQREVGVLAVPYGINAPVSGLGNLSLSWSINGVEHPELGLNKNVTLRAPDGSSGTSDIELSITNKKDILQRVGSGFRVIFSDQTQ